MVTNRVAGIPIFIAIMFFVYWLAVSVGGGIVTDWANDGISGDGWLYTGTEAYEEAVAEREGAQEIVAAYEEADPAPGEPVMLEVEGDDGEVAVEEIDYATYAAAVEVEEPDPASGEYGIWIHGLSPVVDRGAGIGRRGAVGHQPGGRRHHRRRRRRSLASSRS